MKRRITIKQVGQWALLVVITTWGMLAFMVLAGDENPEMPLSLAEFVGYKLLALLNLGLAVLTGKACDKRGWLPDLEKHFGRDNYARH